jgi:ribosomal protein S24E
MLKKLKAGAEEAATTAGIEAAYLQGKKNGFHHPPEVEAQVTIMREVREEIPLLREDISSQLNHQKELAASETKAGADFVAMSDHSSQHPQLKSIMQLFGALETTTASNRYNLHAQIEQIKEEWKVMETVQLKDIRVKQDQMNRAWSTKRYWDKEKKAAKAAEFDSRYKVFVSEFVHLVHDLREKKEELLPGYLLSIVQAEMEFHRKTLEELVKCESTIRNMGRITPIPFNGYDQFVPLPTPEGGAPLQESTSHHSQHSAPAPTPVPTHSQHSAPPASRVIRAKGAYPFQGQSPDELSFNPGDELVIIDQTGDWWTAEMGGRRGLIPANYVQLI